MVGTTGPAEGKIRVDANVSVCWREGDEFECEELPSAVVYVHLAGYAGATVTHIDIEGREAEAVISDVFDLDGASHRYVELDADGSELLVSKEGYGYVLLEFGEKVFGSAGCTGIVGLKEGGVFIGLCRSVKSMLEEWVGEAE